MSKAIERLAAELMKLSHEEWTKLDQIRLASQARDSILDEAAESDLPERLREFDRKTGGSVVAGQAGAADARPVTSKSP